MASRIDRLAAWAGAILDLLTHHADERDEEAISVTALEVVLPALAISPLALAHDNDS